MSKFEGPAAIERTARQVPTKGKVSYAVLAVTALSFAVSGCGSDDGVDGHNALVAHVERTRVGTDADHWIEMKNMAGEWERTGLIFGYLGDYDECLKAIAGLKQANDAREYRCVPAN